MSKLDAGPLIKVAESLLSRAIGMRIGQRLVSFMQDNVTE